MDEMGETRGLLRFEPHAWDKRQRDRPTGEYKALVCGIALLGAAHGTPFEILELWIRANLERRSREGPRRPRPVSHAERERGQPRDQGVAA